MAIASVSAVALLLGGKTAAQVFLSPSGGSDAGVAADLEASTVLWAFNRGNVVCGWNWCDCSWVSGGPGGSCSIIANDHTTCWSCCCQSFYQSDYNHAIEQWRGNGDYNHAKEERRRDRWMRRHKDEDGEERNQRVEEKVEETYDEWDIGRFDVGDWVVVKDNGEKPRYAKILKREGPHHYHVRYEDGEHDTIPDDSVVPRDHPWWFWVLWILAGIVVILAIAVCIHLICRQLKPQSDSVERVSFVDGPEELSEPKPQRSCTWCGDQ